MFVIIITGTQTLKGYPMFQQHASSSDKEIDDVPGRKRDLRDRMPLRSRENHPPNKNTTRHIRDKTEQNSIDRQNSRELRGRPERDLKERTEQEKDASEQTRPTNEEKDTRYLAFR